MTVRDKVALSIPPLFLRCALAATFIWAGYAKVFLSADVPAESAAVLANMGASLKGAGPAQAPAPPPATSKPSEAAPPKPPEEKQPQPPAADSPVAPEQPLPDPKKPVSREVEREPARPHVIDAAWTLDDADAPAPTGGAATPTATTTFSAADFHATVSVPRKWMVALVLHGAAHPKEGAGRTWPKEWATGKIPLRLAEIASWTELVGGVLALVGLFTRLAGAGLFSTMVVAIWLTTIGPVVTGPDGSPSFLGFLPPLGTFDTPAWQMWLFQLAMAMCALALVFSRAGALSLDSLLFSGPRAEQPAPKK